ncbi:MAG: endonuclease III [Candidatus Fermentibacteraceae bacterium]
MKRSEVFGIILGKLPEMYPDAKCMLDFQDPGQLLVATVLAAQTTDEAVNKVMPVLWRAFPSLRELAVAGQTEVEKIVHPLGFFRNKARSIIGAARHLTGLEHFPSTMEELLKVPGVGRKTANVVLGECFDMPAIIVDTHVKRLSGRLDLTDETDPDRIELDLKKHVPDHLQTSFSHQLGFHGRALCKARSPLCPLCPFLFCRGRT